LIRFQALRLAGRATALLLCIAATARAAEPFRLTPWFAEAPHPRFNLVDGNHVERSPADFRGKVSIVYFGFTQCPDVCPSELFKLSLIVKRMGSLASQVRVLFVTLDPEHDTPERLKAYLAAFDPQFVGLTGSAADINEAAASFSVQFAKVLRGNESTIDHSTGVYVLDRTGRLRLIGTRETGIDDYVHDLKILAAD
jgi:protein SCO1